MGHIVPTQAGGYRANWRDAAGRQRAKTFPTKREAKAYLAEVETASTRGLYVDPHAGRIRFGAYAARWLTARNDEITTAARDASIMRNHVIARWGTTPLAKIDHLAVQQWVTELGARLSPATVAECYRLTSVVLRSAVRDRLIGHNSCEGVRLSRRRRKDTDDQVITQHELITQLLPAVPDRYRALVGLAGGTGLRWGECAGLRWDALDLVTRTLRVVRVAVEVSGHVTDKPYRNPGPVVGSCRCPDSWSSCSTSTRTATHLASAGSCSLPAAVPRSAAPRSARRSGRTSAVRRQIRA
jgi:integrase